MDKLYFNLCFSSNKLKSIDYQLIRSYMEKFQHAQSRGHDKLHEQISDVNISHSSPEGYLAPDSPDGLQTSVDIDGRTQGSKWNRMKKTKIFLMCLACLILLMGLYAVFKPFKNQVNQANQAQYQNSDIQVIRVTQKQLIKKQIMYMPKYKKFNQNLAHYLLEKKNISNLMCLNCSKQTVENMKNQVYYQVMRIDANPFRINNYWIHAPRYTKQIQTILKIQELLNIVKKSDSQNLKGFSIYWNQTWSYLNSSDSFKRNLPELCAQMGFHYIEIVSLNLRYTQEGIIMLFQKQLPTYKPLPFTPSNKKVVSFQSVFRMAENIPFMREYFIYHLQMGISRFFLYDNDGTTRDDLGDSSAKLSKHGLNMSCILPQQRKIEMFNELWEDFQPYIIYIPWQPLKNGSIIYYQVQATYNYLHFYQDVTPWTIYVDFDQFVYSNKDLDLSDYVLAKEKEGVTYLTLQHYKLRSRFCADGQLATQGTLAMDLKHQIWAVKIIILNTAMKVYRWHSVEVRFGTHHIIDAQEFKFYHYNMVYSQFKWAWNYNMTKGLLLLYSNTTYIDQTMTKHVPMLKKYCNNKCSDTFKFPCTIQQRHVNNFCLEIKDYTIKE